MLKRRTVCSNLRPHPFPTLQLDKLGVAFGYIYPGDPTQFTLMPDATHHSSVPAITNQTLLKALASATAFDELYISYSEKALKCLYAASGLRTVRLIRCDIASIHFNRGRWQQAYDIFRDMLQLDDADAAVDDPAQRPSIDAWTAIDLDILMKLARCLKEMGVAYAQEYRRMCGLLVLLHDRLTVEQVKYYTALLEEATSDSLPANESDASVEIDMARLCTVQLLQQNPGSDDFFTYDDGRVIQARVMFGSPVPMRVHSAELLMYGKHGQEVSFSSCVSDDSVASTTATMGVVLSPGANLFRMQCPSDVPAGQYVAGKFLLHMSAGTGVDFAQSYLHPSTPKQLFTVRESEQCLKISVTSATTATVELKRDAEFGGWGAKGAAGWTAPRFSPLAVPNESVVLRLYTRDNSIAEVGSLFQNAIFPVATHSLHSLLIQNSELSFASNTGLVVSDGQTCTVSVYREPSHTSLADLSHGANGEEGCVADQKSTIKEVAIKDDKLRLPIVIPKHCIVEILIEVEDRKWNTAFAAWDSAGEGEAVNERRHDVGFERVGRGGYKCANMR